MKLLKISLVCALLVCTSILHFSCEDRFYKKKFDINYSITNRSDSIIKEIKVEANNGAKVWVFENISPGKAVKLTFNIKRDLQTSEGSVTLFAVFNDRDSLKLGAAYYTNWYYSDQMPTSFNIYNDRIEGIK